MLPLKLEKLHLCGTLAVLLNRLPIETLYLKYVERFVVIIQWLKVLLDKDLVSKLYSYCRLKSAIRLYPLDKSQGLYTSRKVKSAFPPTRHKLRIRCDRVHLTLILCH